MIKERRWVVGFGLLSASSFISGIAIKDLIPYSSLVGYFFGVVFILCAALSTRKNNKEKS
ncbi:hypothetical protein D0U04_29605 [Bacillus clarus]|uniref:Group-specific protein n=1 Tax=Bacillus clarus TaxID=2338372 RepID=A0ABX9KN76_9BACI|nr:hypothetical protein [Bacillus clarus]RFT61919.1 hypothetical protein D0U04_29605 [Bacillus clarus]